MNPGILNTKIIVQKKAVTKVDGFDQENWKNYVTLWSEKTGLSGMIKYQAAATNSESDVLFRIRYIKGITAAMRILEGTHTYDIKGDPVDKTGKKRELYITCSEVTAK